MAVYEYRVISARPDDLATHLNDLGEQGWRVVQTTALQRSVVAVLVQELRDRDGQPLRAIVTLADRAEPADVEADTVAVVGDEIELRLAGEVAQRWPTEAVVTVEFYVNRRGAGWSSDEERRLYEEWTAGLPVAQIAKEHGRSESAIMIRARQIGLDPR